MASTLLKMGDKYVSSKHCEFLVDSQADLAELPKCACGSFAYTKDLSTIWMLDAEGIWNQI